MQTRLFQQADIIFDFYACMLHGVGRFARALLTKGVDLYVAPAVNRMVEYGMQRSPALEWKTRQGMHVLGASTPFEFFHKMKLYTAAEISGQVQQDVLVLATSHDHFVPLSMFYRQIEALSNVRSLTARLFTKAEQAQNHCQAGNVGLGLQVIVTWLDQILRRELH